MSGRMNKSKLTNTPLPPTPAPLQVPEPQAAEDANNYSDDEDFDLLIGFNPDNGRARLYSMPNSITLAIQSEQQRDLFIEVGVNVSTEHPWKQISKQFLEDNLSSDTYEMKVLKEKLKEIEDDPLLLIGYVPHLSDETRDMFIIYTDELTCKESSEIIKRLEAFERRNILRKIIKYPKPYQSMGSELTVDSYVAQKRVNTVNVELQSVYPMRYSNANFKFRFSDDVRDGYAELLPDKKVHFNNVYRKMVDRSIQSGARKITEEQQTDPTFPTNQWSQYLYELEEADKKSDAETETIASVEEKKEDEVSFMMARRKKSKEETPVEEIKPQEPEVSQQVENLLEILEFNQVDMYRDDYKFIGSEEIVKYNTPYLEEICCFANIPKCKGQHVISMDWHPEYSGICAVSYGFNLKSKEIKDNDPTDVIKRTIIENNPILIWSFDDPLYPKLELETLREISCISFCPYDGDIIVGGTINGQIMIWDIKNRLHRIESETPLTPEQQRNRNEIREYLKWSKIDFSDKIVPLAAISSIDRSHENAVTSIKWMARNYQCTSKGLLKYDRERETFYKQFVTTSFDGKVLFWDLEWRPSAEDAAKIIRPERKVQLPDELQEESSPYKEIDKIFIPHFSLTFSRPISSFTFNEGEFQYEALNKASKFNLSTRLKFNVTPVKKESFNPKMVLGTTIGELLSCSWDGDDFSQGAILNPQTMNLEPFGQVHDGPVTHVERNNFHPDVCVSLGGRIFALWNDQYRNGPILWRRRDSRLTGVQWSLDRPSVFYLICCNGTLEIWDLNSRIDVPSLSESLGGNILTHISQHKLPLSKRILAIADFNSNLRIFIVPSTFVSSPLPNEKEAFDKFIEAEMTRKCEQDQWKEEWFESNKDIVDAKKDVEQQIVDEKEKKEKMRKEIEEKRAQMAEAEAKKLAKKNARKMNYDLPERLEKKWNDSNFKRLLKVMMERKKVDRELIEKQTKILKDRMLYNEQKKVAIKENLAKVGDDYSSIRARLIPTEEYCETREELVSENVDLMFTTKSLDYKAIEEDALVQIQNQTERKAMTYPEIIQRCKANREILNQSMGGGANSKFERFKMERQRNQMSRYSSITQLGVSRSVTFSADLKDHTET